jgi:hypothetical protein
MALETLKDVKEIGGYNVLHLDQTVSIEMYQQILKEKELTPIQVHHVFNTILFKIQDVPVKENGLNGCQVDTLIETAKIMIESFDEKFPCEENKACLKHLNLAIGWLDARRIDREYRKVEGTSQK